MTEAEIAPQLSAAQRPGENSAPGRRRVSGWVVGLVIALAPVIGVAALRAPIINQNGYLDAWFYSGYGWSLTHHLKVFEDTYYGVRFPPVLLISGASDLFGTIGGYLVLRYLILVATGLALYTCVRHFASRRVAAGAVVLLALDVFYLRLVLWDYVSFVEIPASLAAVALWPRRRGRYGVWAAAGAGALLGAATFSNPLSLVIVPPLVGVEFVMAVRRRDGELARFAVRLGAAIGGCIVLFAIGALIYWAVAGFSPYDMLRPTISFLHDGNAIARGYVLPVHDWIFEEPRIYAPVVFLAGMGLVMRRRLFGTDVAAALGQFSIVFVVELFVYRFVGTDSVIETWWAYGITAVPMAFAGALVLDGVDCLPAQRWVTVIGAVAAAAFTGLLIRLWGVHAVNAYTQLRNHHWCELAVIVVALGGLLLWTRLSAIPGAIAVAVLLIVVTGLSLTPAHYLGVARTGEFSGIPGDEVRGYAVSHKIVGEIAAEDSPASRTLVWYPATTGLLGGIWSTLPSVGGSVNAYDQATPLSRISQYEMARLAYPTTAGVLVLSQNPGDLAQARATLRRAGFSFRANPPRAWVNDRLHYQLLRLRELPAGGTAKAVMMSATAILDAWRRHDIQLLCQLSVPQLVASLTAQDGTCSAGVARRLGATSPPNDRVGTIKVNGDTAQVSAMGSEVRVTLDRVQSEWLVAGGDAPWTH